MRIGRIKDNTTFGILRGYQQTQYGSYLWGRYKTQNIIVCKNDKHKLITVTDKDGWVQSKIVNYVLNTIRYNRK